MIGGAGLKGPGRLPSIARRQLSASAGTSRSISSFRSPISRFPTQYGTQNQSLADKLSWRRPLPVTGSMSARFNSTSTGASAAPQSAGPNTPDPTPGSGLAESSDLSNVDVTTIPEGIGYLKSLGLEYGWGPTSMMQYIIEHIHVWTGLPWWASIIGAGLLLRLALLKPMIGAADNSAKMRNVNHLLAPLNAKATDRSLDEVERAKAVSELRLMFQKHGIKMYKTGLPFLQLPFGFGAFRAVRNMAALPVPGLANETVGWLTDLTARDPYFIVPAAGAALVHLSLKKGGEGSTMPMQTMPIYKSFITFLPFVSFIGMQMLPSALQLYFMATGAFGVCQAYLFSSKRFKEFMGIAIANPPQPTTEQQDPSRLLRLIGEEQRARVEQQRAQKAQQVSSIDRFLDSGKEQYGTMRKWVNEKFDEVNGNQRGKNADGTPAAPPRHSKEQLERAANYNKQRAEEEEYNRQKRNFERREQFRRAQGQKN